MLSRRDKVLLSLLLIMVIGSIGFVGLRARPSANLVILGETLSLGNLVQSSLTIKNNAQDTNPETFSYTYIRMYLNQDLITQLKQKSEVTATTSAALDKYAEVRGSAMPTSAQIISQTNLVSPVGFLYYNWNGQPGYLSPATIDGYDPDAVAQMIIGNLTNYGDTLTSQANILLSVTNGTTTATGKVTHYQGDATLTLTDDITPAATATTSAAPSTTTTSPAASTAPPAQPASTSPIPVATTPTTSPTQTTVTAGTQTTAASTAPASATTSSLTPPPTATALTQAIASTTPSSSSSVTPTSTLNQTASSASPSPKVTGRTTIETSLATGAPEATSTLLLTPTGRWEGFVTPLATPPNGQTPATEATTKAESSLQLTTVPPWFQILAGFLAFFILLLSLLFLRRKILGSD